MLEMEIRVDVERGFMKNHVLRSGALFVLPRIHGVWPLGSVPKSGELSILPRRLGHRLYRIKEIGEDGVSAYKNWKVKPS